tara:strand:+ start:2972 stop:4156 length:1185 start_codon:yes stop_codon:yes gene_type:complete
MQNTPGFVATLLALTLSCTQAAGAVSASQMTLGDIVDVAVLRQQQPGGGIPYQASSWLATSPSLGVSYLDSDESNGTDETELSLNLPFKSGYAREVDRELRALSEDITAAEQLRRRLYYSGLIRETLWAMRLANTREGYARKKVELLEGLVARQQTLYSARASSRYGLLLVRQELSQSKAEQQAFAWEASNWLNQYSRISGQNLAPADIAESPPPTELDYAQHPDVRLLNLNWQRQQRLIAAGSAKTSPVNVALSAKRLDNRQLNENQYGVAVDIPLTVFDIASESTRSEWQQASRDYWQLHDELQLDLKRNWEKLQAEKEHLQERQALLDDTVATSADLLSETRMLFKLNEIPYEFWMRRILGDIDSQSDAAINRLLIEQNKARIRQTAGIPL